jgi:gluconolactonase
VVTRRTWLTGAVAMALWPHTAGAARRAPRTIAQGLLFPEGLCALGSGDLLFVEIAAGTLRRLSPAGHLSIVAKLGDGPNGCAIGPDGAAYVTNNGGLDFTRAANGRLAVGGVPAGYRSGSIQRVDLRTGQVSTLYTHCQDVPLKGPNDLVFDGSGNIWFTDTGKIRARDRDQGGLYWCRPDGSEIREIMFPLNAPNGVALSPGGKTLLVALQDKRQIVGYDILGPGRIAAGKIVAAPAGAFSIDNIAVEQDGGIVAAAVGRGGLAVLSPDGSLRETILLDDPVVTALAFGGSDHRTLYAALSTTGRIVALDWPRAGLPTTFGAKA